MGQHLITPYGAVKWLISDTHWNHRRIVEYEPIRTTLGAHHNTVMVRNWQEVVGHDDLVLHLGDVALGGKDQFEPIADRLPGRKLLIRGNHDRWGTGFYRDMGFQVVKPFEMEYRGWQVQFDHYPDDERKFVCYPKHMGVHGHVHSKTRDNRRLINLSVEVIDFRPVSAVAVLDERIAELETR